MEEEKISLKEFINAKFEALEKSTELSRIGMEKRLDSMNEFRQQLKDQNSTFITKAEHQIVITKIEYLEKIVYMGLGGLLVLEVILKLFIK
jgi:hypothetical protein